MTAEEMLKLTQQTLSANFNGNQKNKTTMNVNEKTFEWKVKNTSKEPVTLALIKGTFPDLEDLQREYSKIDGLMDDGVCVTVSGENAGEVIVESKSEKSIAHFLRMCDTYEMLIKDLDIFSLTKQNIQGKIKHAPTSAFESYNLQEILMNKYISTQQFDDKRVICEDINLPLDPSHIIAFTIAPESEMDFCATIVSAKE